MCDANGSNNSSFSSLVNFTTGSCNVTLSASLSDVNCFGGSDGSIDLTVSGGVVHLHIYGQMVLLRRIFLVCQLVVTV